MIKFVPTHLVPDHWPRVREGLEHIRARYAQIWMPDDLYLGVMTAQLSLVDVHGDGYMVLKAMPDDDHRAVLFVWTIFGALKPYEDELNAWLEARAMDARCARVRIISPRKGWARRGWTLKGYVYEREVIGWRAGPAGSKIQ